MSEYYQILLAVLMLPIAVLLIGMGYMIVNAFRYGCAEYDSTLGPFRPWQK